jgi:pentatricopeptide repeat protein
MLDMYGRCGELDQAESLFHTIKAPDVVHYTVLVKAYAMNNRADQATEVIHKMLRDSHVEPNSILFNTLIDAWAESSQSDAVEQAFSFLQLMEQDP